ncbi:MAG: deoxyuridine 5'-triphosphate nucleotidohydrolase [Anaerolinea sp.]|nr:deoxyuridine 5'-triphosphate nucleotidohydrolase [Anaerolinea sp.]
MGSVLSAAKIRDLQKNNPPLIEGLLDADQQIQPNGVDLSLYSVQAFQSGGQLGFTSAERVLPQLTTIEFKNGWVDLPQGQYLVTFNEIVHLPVEVMALGRPRSSLLRMAVSVGTAVWDAGYNGRSQSLLIVYNPGGVQLAQNARLLQLVFFEIEGGTHAYDGFFQNENMNLPKQKDAL